ncbi:hypothetical protein [Tateyamaria sp.]|uniref:hypothetical protein n=1 Tax=Tateyamaria sp. TaxID=1929288 RepID=UPI00329DB262
MIVYRGQNNVEFLDGDFAVLIDRTGLSKTIMSQKDTHICLTIVTSLILTTLYGDSHTRKSSEFIHFVATKPDIVKSAIMAGPL